MAAWGPATDVYGHTVTLETNYRPHLDVRGLTVTLEMDYRHHHFPGLH